MSWCWGTAPPPSVGELRRLLQWGAHAPCTRQGYAVPSTRADSRAYRISHLARRSPSVLRSDGIIGRHSDYALIGDVLLWAVFRSPDRAEVSVQTRGLRPINSKPAASPSCTSWGRAAKLFQSGSPALALSRTRQSDTSRCSGAARNASASESDMRVRSASSHSEASQD